jgi:2-dehydropantoate 2-reductase
MKTAVIGCGGIGGVIAGVLAVNGHEVTCIEVSDQAARMLRERGISIRGMLGELRADVAACAIGKLGSDSSGSGAFELTVTAVKNDSLHDALELAGMLTKPDGLVLTIQNGLRILGLAGSSGAKIAAGAVGFNAVMHDYGDYEVTARGGITAGPLGSAGSSDMVRLQDLLRPYIPIEVTGNIHGVLWSKLITVCAVTGLGGVSGLQLGKLLREKSVRRLFPLIACEGVKVADGAGVRLQSFTGGISPRLFTRGALVAPVRWLLLTLAAGKYRDLKSNIHHSLERGIRSEVDYINGALVEQGERVGVPTPVNREIVRIVHEIEEGRQAMGAHNLEYILEKAGKS